MKKINLKNLSMDEVLNKAELKKIIGGNGSDEACQTWHCICMSPGWPTTVLWQSFPQTCSFDEIETMWDNMSACSPESVCALIG